MMSLANPTYGDVANVKYWLGIEDPGNGPIRKSEVAYLDHKPDLIPIYPGKHLSYANTRNGFS
jgi:hypothetical protein